MKPQKSKNLYVMKPNNSTGVNIKGVSPAGAMRNMRRGTGIRCAVVVLAVVVSGFRMGFEGEAMG